MILCAGFYCITFVEYMIARKTLIDYTNVFFFFIYQKNEKTLYKYFKDRYDRRKRKP